jgi:hypothetical protein
MVWRQFRNRSQVHVIRPQSLQDDPPQRSHCCNHAEPQCTYPTAMADPELLARAGQRETRHPRHLYIHCTRRNIRDPKDPRHNCSNNPDPRQHVGCSHESLLDPRKHKD